MNLTFDRIDMLKIAQKLSKVAIKNKASPQSGILLCADADNFEVKLTASNLTVEATAVFSAAVKEGGSAIIDADFFSSLLAKFKGATVSLVVTENHRAILRCEQAIFEVMTRPATDWSPLPGENIVFSGEITNISELIKSTVNVVSKEKEDISPLKAVKLSFSDKVITTAATDSRKMLLCRKESEQEYQGFSVLVPATSLKLFFALMKDADSYIVEAGKKVVSFKSSDMFLSSRTIEGHFPMIEDVVRQFKGCYEAVVNAKEFQEILSSAIVIATGSVNGLIQLEFSLCGVTVCCKSDTGGFKANASATVNLPMQSGGFYYSAKSILEGIGFFEGIIKLCVDTNGILMACCNDDVFLQTPSRAPVTKGRTQKTKTKKSKKEEVANAA